MTSLGADDVVGRSLYQLCHVNDLTTLRHAHAEGWFTRRSCRVCNHDGACYGAEKIAVYGVQPAEQTSVKLFSVINYY